MDLWFAEVRGMLALAGPLLRLGRKNIAHLLRVLPRSVADLLNEWFESNALKGALAANGVRDITFGPMEGGTAYTLLYKWALSNSGLFRAAGQVNGRMEDFPLEAYQAISPVFEADVVKVFDPLESINKRNTVGGTSLQSVKTQISKIKGE